MPLSVFDTLAHRANAGIKSAVVLLDPDNCTASDIDRAVATSLLWNSPFILIGGSIIVGEGAAPVVKTIRNLAPALPTVLFPGNASHFTPEAHALLLLSLVSGRNPEFLIGQHVTAAYMLKQSGLELIPTAYLLIDGGRPTTVSYISNTTPLPADKPALASATSLAATQLGLKLVYLDAGSGALTPVAPEIISAVKAAVNAPVVVGGGINTSEKAAMALTAGADLIVVGNALEPANPLMDIHKIAELLKSPAVKTAL